MEEERKAQEDRERGEGGDLGPVESSSAPGWRGWLVSILVAIILSVAATLLLGGGLSLGIDGRTAAGCGPHAACCPDAADGSRGGR